MNMKIRTNLLSGQGMGDTVANLAQLTGLNKIAQTYEQVTGKSCGCQARQDKLNSLFQLPSNNA